MTTVDRLSSDYEPRFDIDYEYGRQAELWVDDVAKGLATGRVEVKHDARAVDTGNLYVEFACYRRRAWRKSGLATTEAETWVFVVGERGVAFVVRTDTLRELCRPLFHGGRWREETDGSHPTKGVLLPIAHLAAHCRKAVER